jgi:hypothetical protein
MPGHDAGRCANRQPLRGEPGAGCTAVHLAAVPLLVIAMPCGTGATRPRQSPSTGKSPSCCVRRARFCGNVQWCHPRDYDRISGTDDGTFKMIAKNLRLSAAMLRMRYPLQGFFTDAERRNPAPIDRSTHSSSGEARSVASRLSASHSNADWRFAGTGGAPFADHDRSI